MPFSSFSSLYYLGGPNIVGVPGRWQVTGERPHVVARNTFGGTLRGVGTFNTFADADHPPVLQEMSILHKSTEKNAVSWVYRVHLAGHASVGRGWIADSSLRGFGFGERNHHRCEGLLFEGLCQEHSATGCVNLRNT